MAGITVGVDGSHGARDALEWAMNEAALRHLPLTVITVLADEARPATAVYWGLRHPRRTGAGRA